MSSSLRRWWVALVTMDTDDDLRTVAVGFVGIAIAVAAVEFGAACRTGIAFAGVVGGVPLATSVIVASSLGRPDFPGVLAGTAGLAATLVEGCLGAVFAIFIVGLAWLIPSILLAGAMGMECGARHSCARVMERCRSGGTRPPRLNATAEGSFWN